MIFIYAGDNDIADKKSPIMLLDDFKKLTDLVNEKIDECSIFLCL